MLHRQKILFSIFSCYCSSAAPRRVGWITATAHAQTATMGALRGTLHDATGAVLPSSERDGRQ
jgi:hypothetical protein